MQGSSNSIGSNGVKFRRVGEDILALTAGLGAGVGMMYLCDPHRGRARCNRLIARTARLFYRDERTLGKRATDMLNRVQGFVADAASALAPEEHVQDEVLLDRVRSRTEHVLSHPKGIQIHARRGVVTLEGKLTHAEKQVLKAEVSAIPGVTRVNDRLKSGSVFSPGLLLWLVAGLAMFSKTNTGNIQLTRGGSHPGTRVAIRLPARQG
jgi:hypothetical protein